MLAAGRRRSRSQISARAARRPRRPRPRHRQCHRPLKSLVGIAGWARLSDPGRRRARRVSATALRAIALVHRAFEALLRAHDRPPRAIALRGNSHSTALRAHGAGGIRRSWPDRSCPDAAAWTIRLEDRHKLVGVAVLGLEILTACRRRRRCSTWLPGHSCPQTSGC